MHPVYDRSNPMATLIDYYLDHAVHRTYLILAHPQEDDVVKISFREYARATHRFAKWLQGHVEPGRVVAFLPQADTLSELTAICGVIRAGNTIFPISPRLNPESISLLLQKVNCHTLLVTGLHSNPLVESVRLLLAGDDYTIEYVEIPPLATLYPHLGKEATPESFERLPLPDPATYPHDIVFYMHTSGSSSGVPKAVGWTHEFISVGEENDSVRGMRNLDDAVIGTQCLPTGHTFGILSYIMIPLNSGNTAVAFAPTYKGLPTPDAMLRTLRAAKTTVVWVVPLLLEFWAASDDAVDFLASMMMVGYGGGPLAENAGKKLHERGVPLVPMYGGTETSAMGQLLPIEGEYAWIRFGEAAKPRWIDQGNGTYELQFLTCATHKPAVENLPDTQGFATRDLFVPHPTKPDLWKIVGRLDDVLVLSNGEKVMPVDTESLLRTHPKIDCALVFGHGEEQVGVLLEPHSKVPVGDAQARDELIDAVWPTVQAANERAPVFARILKEMIMLTLPDKPMVKAGKGTVLRARTVRAYDDEIRQLYATGGSSAMFPKSDSWTTQDLASWLARLVKSVQKDDSVEITDDGDLFHAGFDSLSATALRTRIVNALRKSPIDSARQVASLIAPDFVYANPSKKRLQAALETCLRHGSFASNATHVNDLVRHYTERWPPAVVIITGTTGSLGCYLLDLCLKDERVRRVYAINRPSSRATVDWHASMFGDRGLDQSLLASKVVFIQTNLQDELLGLRRDIYIELCTSVTHIFHLAWRLDFNLKLTSFEMNIQGTRHLLDLALAARGRVRFIFTSSVSVASSWPLVKGPYPEEPVNDAGTVADASGYGQSKFVAEQLLAHAASQGLETCALRIGQITGARASGVWATSDWVPIFVKSSVTLGCLPSANVDAAWLPVDTVARVISDIAFASEQMRPAYNVVHPRPVSWNHVFGLIADALVADSLVSKRLPLVPLSEWYTQLQSQLARGGETMGNENLPAGKLLAFIEALASGNGHDGLANIHFATEEVNAASPSFRALNALDMPDVAAWVRYWGRAGLLSERV